ncbi:MAG: SDR family oxidoreductase [Lentisphaeria bacterium]|nr:SDR family oxidoreductase [Lentisphaeria bacterium]
MSKKTAVITGGAGYIGSAVAKRFASQGIQVILFDCNQEQINKVSAEIGAEGMVVDVTDYAAVAAAVESVKAKYGTVDILVNVAGGSARSEIRPFAVQKIEVIHQVIDMNMYGALHCIRAVAPIMIEQKSGVIVNFSSAVALGGIVGCADYGASKGAIMAATKSLAMEFGQYNIRINCVCPGKVQRPDAQPADVDAFVKKHTYLNVLANAEDVADLVEFLASDKARCITGQNYVIDNGRSLGLRGDRNRTDC